MRISLLIASVGLASSISAAPPKFTERFHLSKTCDGKGDFDKMLTDTIDMIEVAIKAITSLQTSILNPILMSPTNRAYVDAAYTAFGVPRPTYFSTKLSSSDSGRLSKAKVNYNLVLSALKDGVGMFPKHNFFLCDPKNLIFVKKVSDVLVNHKDKDELFITGYKTDGVWKDPDNKDAVGDFLSYGSIFDKDGKPIPVCEGDHQAITWYQSPKRMIFCPLGLSLKASLKEDHDKGKTGKLEWQEHVTKSGIFLHEMMHWLGLKEHIKDEMISGETKDGSKLFEKAYGDIGTWILGEFQPELPQPGGKDRTLTNADSYHVFAVMSYLDKAEWM